MRKDFGDRAADVLSAHHEQQAAKHEEAKLLEKAAAQQAPEG